MTLRRLTAEERFAGGYTVDPRTGCWLWTRALHDNGYAAFRADGRQWKGHRWSYTQKHGTVPDGLQLDHFVCDIRHCVNPDHVRPVSPRENVLRSRGHASRNLAKSECPQGHPYDIVTKNQRDCLTCRRKRDRLNKAAARARARAQEHGAHPSSLRH